MANEKIIGNTKEELNRIKRIIGEAIYELNDIPDLKKLLNTLLIVEPPTVAIPVITSLTLEEYKELILPGWYRHYKSGLYQVLDIGIHSETNEILVSYKNFHSGSIYFRPANMFLDQIPDKTSWDENATIPRFKYLGILTGENNNELNKNV